MNPLELRQQFQNMDFNYWLNELLSNISDDMDTREGSVIYDALAPVAAVLDGYSLNFAESIKQLYIQTATGQYLDWRVAERGLSREEATHAQVTAYFTNSEGKPLTNVNVNDRFSSVGDELLFYTVVRVNDGGTAVLKAETIGTKANGYTGQLLPVTPNDALSWAEITEISVPARDDEDDEHLRERALTSSDYIAYGGNVADYQSMMKKITDVGATQIYPAWQGGGTVKLVVLDNNMQPASNELIKQVKSTIDPEDETALGYGYAPIGHHVTVVAPTPVKLDITSRVLTDGTVTLSSLKSSINDAISNYFVKQRDKWANYSITNRHRYDVTIYQAQLLSAILSIDHVINASLPKINGQDMDIKLNFTNDKSELPILGEVILNE